MRLLAFFLWAAVLCGQTIPAIGTSQPSGGAPPPCGSGISHTSLAHCMKFTEATGDNLGDSVGALTCQLGSSAGADANDPDWDADGLVFTGANDDRVVCPAFNDASDNFTLTVVLETGADDGGFIPVLISQLGGAGTALRYLAQASSDVLFTNLGTPPAANVHSATLTDSTWYALTIRNNSGSVCLAVNGGTPECATETVPTCDGDLLLGVDNDLSGNEFTGRMAYMLFYSAAVADGVIASNYTGLQAIMTARGETL